MLNYIIHTSSIWIILLIVYKLFLNNEKYFKLNRIYLLSSLMLGLMLPFIQIIKWTHEAPILKEVSTVYHEQVQVITSWTAPASDSSVVQQPIDWFFLLFQLVCIGMFVMLIKNLLAARQIKKLYDEAEVIHHKRYSEVLTSKQHLPFSFLRFIFFSSIKLKAEDRTKILEHEIYHVEAKHTWDIILIEAIKVFFWWNPVVYFYKYAIIENHEFAADHAVIKNTSRKEYCSLLLQSNMEGVNLDLSNPFFQSFIKKRIMMMYRENSPYRNYLKFILPILLLVCMAFVIVDNPESDHLLLTETIDKVEMSKGVKMKDFRDISNVKMSLFDGKEKLNCNVDYVVNNGIIKLLKQVKNQNVTVEYEEVKHLNVAKEIPFNLHTNYIDLVVDDHFLIPNKDYYIDRERNVVVIINEEYLLDSKVKTCMYAIDSPRPLSFFEDPLSIKLYQTKNNKTDTKIEKLNFIIPVSNSDIKENTVWFGMRMHPVKKKKELHKGIDLICDKGSHVFASESGIVVSVKSNKDGYGKYIIIDHGHAYSTLYAHLHTFNVTEGQRVDKGDKIGEVGSTGMSTKPHLHFEIRLNGEPVNPSKFDMFNARKLSDNVMLSSLNPVLESCEDDSIEELIACTNKTINEFANSHKEYPKKALKSGFQGLVIFPITIDAEGQIKDYEHIKGLAIEENWFSEEKRRIVELLQDEFIFTVPNVKDDNIDFKIFIRLDYKIGASELERVEIRNATNTENSDQKISTSYITDQGLLNFMYKSEMNVPFKIKITDPAGKLIYDKEENYMYKQFSDHFFIPNKLNGDYTIVVTQDGTTVTKKLQCEMF